MKVEGMGQLCVNHFFMQGLRCVRRSIGSNIPSPRKWSSKPQTRKLDQLDSVESLDELRVPPGNRFEQLSGERRREFSLRINDPACGDHLGVSPCAYDPILLRATLDGLALQYLLNPLMGEPQDLARVS